MINKELEELIKSAKAVTIQKTVMTTAVDEIYEKDINSRWNKTYDSSVRTMGTCSACGRLLNNNDECWCDGEIEKVRTRELVKRIIKAKTEKYIESIYVYTTIKGKLAVRIR